MFREILYRYWALHRLDLARDVYDLFVQVCPVVVGVTLADTDRARDLLVEVEGISTRDAVRAAVIINHQVELIASFDPVMTNLIYCPYGGADHDEEAHQDRQ